MKKLCKNKNWKLNKEYDLDKILYLLIDRPTYINCRNDFAWNDKEGYLHRDYNLPAVMHGVGYISWYKNNKRYRENNKLAKIINKTKIIK